MIIKKTVKLQKQTITGTVSMTLPKQFSQLLNFEIGEKVEVILDTEHPEYLKISKLS